MAGHRKALLGCFCVALFGASVAAAEDSRPRLWFQFLVSIDAQHHDQTLEHGKGAIVGRAGDHLLVATANHVVRSRDGQAAAAIAARLAWDAAGPRPAELTGLFDANADVALVAVPIEYEEGVDGSLVIGCVAALRVGAQLEIGDDLGSGARSAGTFEGRDASGNLIVRNASTIRGQSGAPLIDADGAVVGILVSSEGAGGRSIGVPIDRLEAILKDGTSFDALWSPMTDAETGAYADQLECAAIQRACDRYRECVRSCDSGQPGEERTECLMSRCAAYDPCEPTRFVRCGPRSGAEPREPVHRLDWEVTPTCACVDSRLSEIADAEVRERHLACAAPGLFAAAAAEERSGWLGMLGRLTDRFPARRSELEGAFTEEQRGQLWAYYERLTQRFSDRALHEQFFHDDDKSLEAVGLAMAGTRLQGLPVCRRLPERLTKAGSTGWLRQLGRYRDVEEERFYIEGYRRATTECVLPVASGIDEEIGGLFFVQVGGEWVFLGTAEMPKGWRGF